jgi:hypothetical protein
VCTYHIEIERDPVRHPVNLVFSVFLRSDVLIVLIQDLDSFISPIPSFEGDIPIPAIPVSACSPGGEAIDDPSATYSAGALRTQANKWKAMANLIPLKKAKKAIGRSSSEIKINKPMPKTSASTPPSSPWKGIPIHQSRRYCRLKYFFYHWLSGKS